MPADRRLVLAGLLAMAALVTAVILRGLVGTIFFAITVAYVLVPLADRLEREGIPSWWAALVATASAFGFGLALLLPIAAVLYVRRAAVLGFLRGLPDAVTLRAGELTYVVESGDVAAFLARQLSGTAISLARSTPVTAAKLAVFAFVVFALVYRGERLEGALLTPLPDAYHDVAIGLHERTRETLVSLYVIQAATAVATFLVALVVFWALGVPFYFTLAVVAGVLQFLPVVGPSLVVGAVAVGYLVADDVTRAAVVLVVGLVAVGFLPDALLRPRLARETARLPGSLYFVGFTGGLLSLGPVGIVAGPLAIVLLVELLGMLGAAVRPDGPLGARRG